MNSHVINILYIEDNLADYKLLTSRLKSENLLQRFDFSHVTSIAQADEHLLNHDCDLTLLDLSLPDAHGLEGLHQLLNHFPELPIVVLTGNTDDSLAIEAIKQGAQDYLVKQDLRADIFVKMCNYAIERKKIIVRLKEAILREEELNDELRETNEELNQAFGALQLEKKRVEEKSQQINSFISMLVNDLKNPISAISSLIGLIQEEKNLTEKQSKYLKQIERSSDSMLENIMRIIDTQYAADGVVKVNLQPENPYFTLNSAIDKYVVEAIRRNIIIEVTYSRNLPTVLLDKSTLNSAISGVFEFIFKHTQKASRLLIGCNIKDDYLEIQFVDKQLVISDKVLQESLEIETDNSFDTQWQPAEIPHNMELSFVRQLLRMMSGELKVSPSERYNGTVFNLYLRLANN